MSDLSQSDSSGFAAGFLLGLLVGGAGGYLLSTEKGQELLESLKENAGDKLKEIAENPAIADRLADLEKTMAEARATLSSTGENVESKVHEVASQVAAATAPPDKPKKRFFFKGGSRLGK